MTAAPFCFAQALAHDPIVAPALAADSHGDVCLVGGGFTGLRAARH
jgi:NADPH-dependent 2,4-dienoyl-CoA reductase/sulfur reductase-like enzyme